MTHQPDRVFDHDIEVFGPNLQLARSGEVEQPFGDGIGPFDGVAHLLQDHFQIVIRLGQLPAALARLIVIRLAEQAAGTYVPQAGERVAEILALGRRGGRAELHVGGLAGAVIENGVLEMVKLPAR